MRKNGSTVTSHGASQHAQLRAHLAPYGTPSARSARISVTREEAKSDVFNYIEMFYNTRRQHGHNDGLSPVEFEKRQSK